MIRMFYYHRKLGPEYVRRFFGEMDITLFRDSRLAVDWLVGGRYPISFFSSHGEIGRAQRQGLPIAFFGRMKEGENITSSSGVIGFVNRAPHPNAAKVFINWLLSREGQIVVQTEYAGAMAGASNSLRIDIPKDMIPPNDRLQEGIEYMKVETLPVEPVLNAFNEALAKAGK
jgi:ABC-type glycerol-3-phosphate transport system substrate-binding protein